VNTVIVEIVISHFHLFSKRVMAFSPLRWLLTCQDWCLFCAELFAGVTAV